MSRYKLNCEPEDVLSAISQHPKITDSDLLKELKKKCEIDEIELGYFLENLQDEDYIEVVALEWRWLKVTKAGYKLSKKGERYLQDLQSAQLPTRPGADNKENV
jgi:DNA-binding PadR family transcriptional regulator